MATIRRDIGAGHHFIFDDALVNQPSTDMFNPEFWHAQDKITGQAKNESDTGTPSASAKSMKPLRT